MNWISCFFVGDTNQQIDPKNKSVSYDFYELHMATCAICINSQNNNYSTVIEREFIELLGEGFIN